MRSDHPNSAQVLEQKINEHITLLDKAVADIRQDKLRDISVMEETITSLCANITALPEREAAQIEPAMVTMIGKLEEFAAALEHYQSRMAEKAGDLPASLTPSSSSPASFSPSSGTGKQN